LARPITLKKALKEWKLYLFLLPALAVLVVFSYYPVISAVIHSLFRWDGYDTEQYIGLENFRNLFQDNVFKSSFIVVFILVFANLFRMIPSMVAAVVIHRLRSDKSQYIYRVLFVVPMIVPGLVVLLIWKFFYEPNFGILNTFLKGTGLMTGLKNMDAALPGLAAFLAPWREAIVGRFFGGCMPMIAVGAMLLTLTLGLRSFRKAWPWWALLLIVLGGTYSPGILLGKIAYGIDSKPVSPGFDRITLVLTMWAILAAGNALSKKPSGRTILKVLGTAFISIAVFFVLTTLAWPVKTGAFDMGAPAWLSQPKLVLPSLIFWGFPWIGVVGVLIYLAGLQAISKDVYEAADLDGVSAMQKFWYIELPLITTQIRLNLILMIIATLKTYGMILVLLGPSGGPNNAAMVPGLWMFNKAFNQQEFGYACALGLVLFFFILVLTWINNKFVRVEK